MAIECDGRQVELSGIGADRRKVPFGPGLIPQGAFGVLSPNPTFWPQRAEAACYDSRVDDSSKAIIFGPWVSVLTQARRGVATYE